MVSSLNEGSLGTLVKRTLACILILRVTHRKVRSLGIQTSWLGVEFGSLLDLGRRRDSCTMTIGFTLNSIKLETGLRPNTAGIPYTLLLRIEAIGFPTVGLLL